MKDNIYLIGSRAVGKSSVGVDLARKLDFEFLDTDVLIVEKCGKSVADIVEQEGWPSFREYEQGILSNLMDRHGCVVATGGGAILHRLVWPDLRRNGFVVWLQADLEILCKRIVASQRSESQRPSLTGKDIQLELKEVLEERNPLYKDTADCIIDSGALMVYDTVLEIVEVYEKSTGCNVR